MLIKIIVILICCLSMQSCASIKNTQALQDGKQLFVAGDYKKAFHELLPAASAGNPEAQYAVGYMYYYGYGVAQDDESGLFWMKKAAAQRYEPAVRGLKLVKLH